MSETGAILYDPQDEHIFLSRKWHISDTGYAVWRGLVGGKKQTIRLHRLITGAKQGEVVDHKNHNKLDNRRSNLRNGTQSDNMRNKTDQGNGYWFHQKNKNWIVEIHGIHRGCFDTEQEAKSFAAQVRAGLADKKPKVERTHCKHGHSLEDAYWCSGAKRCKPCQQIRSKQYYKRRTS